ncbi:hypothetical protein ES703_45732 [subsurface metagenome]
MTNTRNELRSIAIEVNIACCEMLFFTTMVPFLVLGCCYIPHIY